MKKLLLIFSFASFISFFNFRCTSPGKQRRERTAEIGRYLFFDKRLSYNNTKSCASCHDPELAFTDGYHRSIGANGDLHKRNAPTLLNISGNHFFTYADSTVQSIYQQVNIPLFNNQFTELGAIRNKEAILDRINNDPVYNKLLQQAGKSKASWDDIRLCLEIYCQSLNSYKAKYDKVLKEEAIYTPDEKEGASIFFSKELGCSQCHGGVNFNMPANNSSPYADNGFYEPDSSHVTRKFSTDQGLFELSNNPSDIGQFKIPTLRNCMVTAPYMHDGRINTMDSVISIYSKGGNKHVNKHPLITGFSITEREKKQLIRFLQTLTDTSYLKSEYFTDPF